jgi:hypothetical protein
MTAYRYPDGQRISSSVKLMLIATGHWPYVTRFCIALREQGFDLLVLAPPDHAVHRIRGLYAKPLKRSRSLAASIKNMVEAYSLC